MFEEQMQCLKEMEMQVNTLQQLCDKSPSEAYSTYESELRPKIQALLPYMPYLTGRVYESLLNKDWKGRNLQRNLRLLSNGIQKIYEYREKGQTFWIVPGGPQSVKLGYGVTAEPTARNSLVKSGANSIFVRLILVVLIVTFAISLTLTGHR